MPPTANQLLYGSPAPLPQQLLLRAGPLTMTFLDGDLRWIRYGEREIIRRLYAVTRDRNWNTLENRTSNLRIDRGEDRFRIEYDVSNRQDEIHFDWHALIEGRSDGTVTCALQGRALTTFLKNRIGWCVLHPAQECAGVPCRVEKTDGSVVSGNFPALISPHQPFFEIRAITHTVSSDVQAEVRFAGDVFEMEDQRNWTDASYKTYSTPLALPFPARVEVGTEISQSVTLTLQTQDEKKRVAAAGIVRPSPEDPVLIRVEERAAPLPNIGLACASHQQPLTETEVRRLRLLAPAHLRVDLNLAQEGAAIASLRRAMKDARALNAGLEIALLLNDEPAALLDRIAGVLRQGRARVVRWLVFHPSTKVTPARWIEVARHHLRTVDAIAQFTGGTNAYFTELNRERPDPATLDATTFSINPQVHAFDIPSLVETLPMHAAVVESARAFLGRVPVVVSPVTLKARFNPNATAAGGSGKQGELPEAVDPRQMSLFGAGWTAGSLKYLALGGASAVTLYETTGWLGVMEREQGSPLPEKFPSSPGGVFPMFHVLADVAEFAGGEVLSISASDPLRVEALALRKQQRVRMLLANFTPEPVSVQAPASWLGRRATLRSLDASNALRAMEQPETFRKAHGERLEVTGHLLEVTLAPFAVLRIDGAGTR
jgi:D-apionolactonase